jgi:hypothetical protein
MTIIESRRVVERGRPDRIVTARIVGKGLATDGINRLTHGIPGMLRQH